MTIRTLLAVSAAVAAVVGAIVLFGTLTESSVNPATSTDPYLRPTAKGVTIEALLTVSDSGSADDGYEMAGKPDGLGAYKDPRGEDFVLLMNHELDATVGAERRHGEKGAFVSELKIDADSFAVKKGRDLIDPGVRYWDYAGLEYSDTPSAGGDNPRDPSDPFPEQPAAFGDFCSGSLTAPGQLYDDSSGRGYEGQIYFANEETGDEGRVFGVTLDGQAQQLPRLGLLSFENVLAAPTQGNLTMTIAVEDATEGQLWIYLGRKKGKGNEFAKAGLTNGSSFVIDLEDEAVSSDADFRSTYGKGEPAPFQLNLPEEMNWDHSGAWQNEDAKAKGLTLTRPEDGAWDPANPNDFYFVTTEGAPNADDSRDGGGLWRLRFADVNRPQLGGTLTLLLDGSEPPYMHGPDNVDIDRHGNLLIQEDPGDSPHLGRIVAYRISDGARGVLAEFGKNQFLEGGPGLITQDEESSGILDAEEVIGPGWFLFDAQVHATSPDPAAVELGQLLAMRVDRFGDVYTIDAN